MHIREFKPCFRKMWFLKVFARGKTPQLRLHGNSSDSILSLKLHHPVFKPGDKVLLLVIV
ncbi:hypothetical protein DYU05_15425 [Mucilaginibacter terrenus]|uniref:Uncharacterized protein n=1 Tax=Mucilaginibacter terrenus TaxID=2482727 RepID=A0A3E2NM00_9SPHI|nr:hypothetical protein DYU05_15425 [Mucilaginibacter terrenus]